MIWQDIIITIGSVVLLLALIPSVIAKKKDKPPVITSLTTGIILATFSFTFLTLDLLLSGILTAGISTLWLILAYQKHKK